MNKNEIFTLLSPTRSKIVLKGEDKIQREIIVFLQEETLKKSLKAVWFHVPNEFCGNKNKLFGYKLSLLGKIPGAPDLLLAWENQVAFFEIKTSKGVLSPRQKLFQKWCDFNKVQYFVVRSLKDFQEKLKDLHC